jgi:hypothetical protein
MKGVYLLNDTLTVLNAELQDNETQLHKEADDPVSEVAN